MLVDPQNIWTFLRPFKCEPVHFISKSTLLDKINTTIYLLYSLYILIFEMENYHQL